MAGPAVMFQTARAWRLRATGVPRIPGLIGNAKQCLSPANPLHMVQNIRLSAREPFGEPLCGDAAGRSAVSPSSDLFTVTTCSGWSKVQCGNKRLWNTGSLEEIRTITSRDAKALWLQRQHSDVIQSFQPGRG